MIDRSATTRKRTVSAVREEAVSLDPVEEKLLRMSRGYPVQDDLVLERVGQDRPDVAAKLQEIELRALKMSGRLNEIAADSGESCDQRAKQKIISRLKAAD